MLTVLGSCDKNSEPGVKKKKNINLAKNLLLQILLLRKAYIYTNLNLTTKRPGTGISPVYWDSLIGKKSKKNYKKKIKKIEKLIAL